MQDPRSYFVTKNNLRTSLRLAEVECPRLPFQPVPVEVKALPQSLDWLLNPNKGRTLSDRVLARLIQSEAHEADIWLRQDYRQAQICLSLAMRGNTEPFLVSSYTIYGVHPDKVWPRIMSVRKAKLGKEFTDWYSADGILRPDVPKKDSGRVSPATANTSEHAGTATAYKSAEYAPNTSADKFVNERLAALVPPKKETA